MNTFYKTILHPANLLDLLLLPLCLPFLSLSCFSKHIFFFSKHILREQKESKEKDSQNGKRVNYLPVFFSFGLVSVICSMRAHKPLFLTLPA